MAIILISYRLDVLEPPPSLRDTSASGGHGMETFAITTQPPRGEEAGGTSLNVKRKLVKSYLNGEKKLLNIA